MLYEFENGFLDEKINYVVEDVRNKNKELYELIFKYNQFAYEIRNYFVKETSEIELYIFSTFCEIHNNFQSIIILLEHGLSNDAHSSFRTLYDKLFNFASVINNENNYEHIIKDDIYETIKTLKELEKSDMFSENKKIEIRNEIKKFEDELGCKLSEFKKKGVRGKSQEANIKDGYLKYRYLSGYTHTDIGKLFQNLIVKNDGVVINGGVKIENFCHDCLLVIDCFRDIIKIMCNYFNIKFLIDKLVEIDESFEIFCTKFEK